MEALAAERASHRRSVYLQMVFLLVLSVVFFFVAAFVSTEAITAVLKALSIGPGRTAKSFVQVGIKASWTGAVACVYYAFRHRRLLRLHEPIDFARPMILYLRPFDPKSFKRDDLETKLPRALNAHLPALTVYNRREVGVVDSEQREYSDDEWKVAVEEAIQRCKHVFMALESAPGLEWELRQLLEHAPLKASVVLPDEEEERAAVVRMLVKVMPSEYEGDIAALSDTKVTGFRFTEGPDGRLVLVPSTSGRTWTGAVKWDRLVFEELELVAA